NAYYRIGKVSTGFEVWISNSHFNNDYTEYQAEIAFDDSTAPHQRTILVCMNPEKDYQITLNGKTVKSKIYHEGLLEITLPNTNKGGRLTIVSI
ncbi:MAG: glycoside hydrolase, partial [Bacteroides ovatus]|nr:glycoside hydrolase [Bacteroides ovatus]